MTGRMELLDLIDRALAERLGSTKVTRRRDGVIVVAGRSEAFLVQALVVDAPEEADAFSFGEELVEFIRARADHGNIERPSVKGAEVDSPGSDGEVFFHSLNGDQWLIVTDTGSRRFVRHVPNRASGGAVEVVDLQSFRDREPHSPQNHALEALLQS